MLSILSLVLGPNLINHDFLKFLHYIFFLSVNNKNREFTYISNLILAFSIFNITVYLESWLQSC